MANPFVWLKERIFKSNFEPEHEEKVEHDVVMVVQNGILTEVTQNDSEEG